MPTGRPRRLAISLTLAALGVLPACAQPGPLLSRQTTIGTLKTSVSRLEYDNEQLKRELAEARAENRRTALRLDQEEAANGELTARLDDARNLISNPDLEDLAGSTRPTSAPEPADPRPAPAPAGRKPYKPPFAQIRGRIEIPPPPEEEELEPAEDRGAFRGSLRRDDLGTQGRLDPSASAPWLPVARGLGADVR